jgi:hypothetical protein
MKWVVRLQLIILLPAMVWAQGTQAQARKPVSVPAIEDPELYYSFFNYHQNLVNALVATKAANPQNSAQLDQQMATLLQVDVKELPAVINNTQLVTEAYGKLPAKRAVYANAVPKPNQPVPNAKQLAAQMELKRVRITVDGAFALFLNLSPASWSGIHGYIAGTYRNTIYQK